jgi:hypothetical protein
LAISRILNNPENMVKRAFIIAVTTFIVFSLNAQQTEIRYLSGTDKDHTVTWDFFCTNGMNSGKWSTIQVPSQWEQQGFGSYMYGNINLKANEKGLYKFAFDVPIAWKKKKVFIVFEGSMTDTEVKINGKSAGPVHQGAFYRFKYDISQLLIFEGKNLLEVTVSKESANESVNRAERIADYWVFGGIFRPVYLEIVPEQFIDRVAIDAKADGSFYMDVYVQGTAGAKTLEAQIQTMDGKPFGKALLAELTENAEKTTIKGSFSNPALWNPEFPNRYQVVVSLKNGKKITHQFVQKFGFRTVEVKPTDGIYVNGMKVMFRGVCRHTFWPSSGRTSSRQLAINDVNLMKDMNMNAVRMSHYPPDQFFLDVCDSLGLFVLDELGGWQKFYDTPTAKRLVKQMVERDVNHPSIVLWDNGNEGGFNKEARSDYALYDPQNRTVIEPWSIINGTNTKHYPGYNYVKNVLNNNKEIYFPTEFLHGLFDGGHGAGLDDYWNLMLSKPLAAGGFLWVFADEGIERRDKNDSIDTQGNLAPDGILGPYDEKEGSFYTIKEIWSPVQFKKVFLTPDFSGGFKVINRFLYTNLSLCRYSFELVKFGQKFPKVEIQKQAGKIQSPNVAAGDSGILNVNLPSDWKDYDALYITATDQYGRQINTWSWNITQPEAFASRIVSVNQEKVSATGHDSLLIVSSGKTTVTFNNKTGLIAEIQHNNKTISFNNGPVFAGIKSSFKELKHYALANSYVVELIFDSTCHAKWTMLPGGWLQLDYDYKPSGSLDFSGITFSYPESLISGAVLMANGPYHVWKNRLKGTRLGVYDKLYNNTITGQTWDYPEFKGYYSNFFAVEVQNKELPFTIVSGTNDLFLHLFTPQAPKHNKGGVNPPFPTGTISVLNGISAIGTKFTKSAEEGPQGEKNDYGDGTKILQGKLYFRFGE